MLSPGTILQDRYRVIRQLGRGGMGTVYEAMDERVSAVVVVKEANEAGSESQRREFEREARLLANLQHKTLPKVMDYFVEGGFEYLVMEYVPGYDLGELLRRRGSPFHPKAVLRWADELLQVLEYLHGLRPPILHRDIKPANLKLTQREDLYLLDFGLAKGAAGSMTMTQASRSVHGFTPVYAPLEQIAGQGTDARSDLYALGATLYHLLTNVVPASAPVRDEELEHERPDPLTPIRRLNPKVPPGVAEVIHRAMAIRRKNRFESAAEMRRALADAAAETLRDDGGEAQQVGAQGATPAERMNYAPPTVPPAYGLKTDPADGRGTREPQQPGVGEFGQKHPAPAAAEFPRPRVGPVRRKSLLLFVVIGVAALAVVITAILLARNARQSRSAAGVGGEEAVQPVGAAPTSRLGAPSYTENLNGVPLEMVLILGGTFEMGTNSDEGQYERPKHTVTVPTFYLGKYEVTQAQWRAVMGTEPSGFKGGDLPAERVSWEDAVEFCQRLSAMTGLEYRLPTEAEWEYACRARTTTAFAHGDSIGSAQANFNGGYPYGTAQSDDFFERTTPVGFYSPNGFGLFDMHGNVEEWVADTFHVSYEGAPADGSAWVGGGDTKYRMQRGGSWKSAGERLRCAAREFATPETATDSAGFRVALAAR
ncbi:MAG TPA: bifunctional serine/threonine-protein kinase/formylglycine-generating enzyme family protein [Pyrinomonadaceae bacterium]|nr:bifunctional serine/threonine-protein kinase/formylglycine-generating enzyme family protein [Pyrinomonadaceae bacterium]